MTRSISAVSYTHLEGRRIVNEAIKSAETKKKEALLEAKEEILKSRSDYEKEEKSRRADLQRQENRLQQKEENLDRKLETIETVSYTHLDVYKRQEYVWLTSPQARQAEKGVVSPAAQHGPDGGPALPALHLSLIHI